MDGPWPLCSSRSSGSGRSMTHTHGRSSSPCCPSPPHPTLQLFAHAGHSAWAPVPSSPPGTGPSRAPTPGPATQLPVLANEIFAQNVFLMGSRQPPSAYSLVATCLQNLWQSVGAGRRQGVCPVCSSLWSATLPSCRRADEPQVLNGK